MCPPANCVKIVQMHMLVPSWEGTGGQFSCRGVRQVGTLDSLYKDLKIIPSLCRQTQREYSRNLTGTILLVFFYLNSKSLTFAQNSQSQPLASSLKQVLKQIPQSEKAGFTCVRLKICIYLSIYFFSAMSCFLWQRQAGYTAVDGST